MINKSHIIFAVFLICVFFAYANILNLLGIKPLISDEFSYLLMADTFSNLRLFNTPHPKWIFFESMHILQDPSYASKYPPMQGIILLIGQVLFNKPILGVVLAYLLASMLCFLLIKRIYNIKVALITSIFFLFLPTYLYHFVFNYWGSVGGILGGFMALLALSLTKENPSFRNGIMLGIGITLMFFTRFFEGAVVSIIILMASVNYSFKQKNIQQYIRKIVPALMLILLISSGWLMYYNYQVTKDPLKLPYQEYTEQYSTTMGFWFEKFDFDKTYRHDRLERKNIQEGLNFQEKVKDFSSTTSYLSGKYARYARVLLPGYLIFLLPILLLFLRSNKEMDILKIAIGGFFICITPVLFQNTHYITPLIPIFVCLWAALIHFLLKRKSIYTNCFCILILISTLISSYSKFINRFEEQQWSSAMQHHIIKDKLESLAGQHVVFIDYGEEIGAELVYNTANIDQQKVIFARFISDSKNQELIDYYPNRKFWLAKAPCFDQCDLVSSYPDSLN